VRILHLTDTHLGIEGWYRGAPPGWRRADDHLAAMRIALRPAFTGEVDLVLHTGDLFDRSRPPARAVAEAAALLAEVGRCVRVLVMPGNHDRRGLRGHFPDAIPGVTVVDEPTRIDVGDVRVALVPFFRDAFAWRDAAAALGGADLLLAHQAFDGARVPGLTFRAGAQNDTIGAAHLPPGIRHVLCGHIHPRQVLRVGGATVVMPGSTERTMFAERGETKGYALWDLAGAPKWRFVDLPSRPMVFVRSPGDVAEVVPEALVRVDKELRTPEIEREVLARGGWLAPWPAPTAQLSLFG
jgi:DNA repair exonuclease SbcCD nuclease subunit